MTTLCTVLGATGFIGTYLVTELRRRGFEVFAPHRGDESIWERPLGQVFYAIGLTADFRERPFDTVEAHVGLLSRVLRECDFQSLLYLSSTRVYANSQTTREGTPIAVSPQDPSDLYNLSKLMGESLALNCGREGVRVARLSNVVGEGLSPQTFVGELAQEASAGLIRLRSHPQSVKDYIEVHEAVRLMIEAALHGSHRVYNVAGGYNVAHARWLDAFARLSGCRVEIAADAPKFVFPEISVERVAAEWGRPSPLDVERCASQVLADVEKAKISGQ